MTYLVHHGILGQKWGVRRFQNPDGSLTPAGQKRYAKDISRTTTYSSPYYVMNATPIRSMKSYGEAKNSFKKFYDSEYNKLAREFGKKHPDQNENEFDEWLIKKKSSSQIEKMLEDERSAWDEYREAKNRVADELVGKYGSMKVDRLRTKYPTTVRNSVLAGIEFAISREVNPDRYKRN